MPCRVEEHPELLAGLDVRFDRSNRECVLFRGVEVLDLKVDVKLLGYGTARPGRRNVLLDLLEVKGGTITIHQVRARDVLWRGVTLGLNLEPCEGGIKARQPEGIRTVNHREAEVSEGHR